MSYARWGWEGSNVYVYCDIDGYLRCCSCPLGSETFFSTADMFEHLHRHRKAGHYVPDSCFAGLEMDRAENDLFISQKATANKRREVAEEETDPCRRSILKADQFRAEFPPFEGAAK